MTNSSPRPVDTLVDLPVPRSREVFSGRIWDIVSEDVDLGSAGIVTREFMAHTGAVAVLVLDEADRVLLLEQYRHPVRAKLWELPAGLLDMPGEPWLEAAQRELAEEADLTARDWHTLADFYTSPGGSDEFIRIFLARDVDLVPEADRHVREDEESLMVPVWVPLTEAVEAVLAGQIHNPSTALGLLAAHTYRQRGWAGLRPTDAPFELKASRA